MKKLLLASLFFFPSISHAAFTTDWLRNTSSTMTIYGTTYYFALSGAGCLQSDGGSPAILTIGSCGGSAAFAVSSFSDGNSATLEIGVGVWKAAGALSFTAAYTNGTAIGSTVTFSGWVSPLPMTGVGKVGPTASGEAVNYPSVAGTVVFSLSAKNSAGSSASSSITHTYVNRRFFGVSTVASGYTEANVEALSSDLSNVVAKTFSLTAGPGEYLTWASPTRLGTVTFFVGGFEGGFLGPETVSITNASGFTENYYVYRSVNSNLGVCNIVTQ